MSPVNVNTMATRRLTGASAPGFTLIESVISMLIVGLMLVAALNTIGASRVTQSRGVEQTLGPMLAEELMAEILNQSYEETVDTPTFGRESGELSGSRASWDDVDDYTEWSASPPEAKDGTALPAMEGWTRMVEVKWVSSVDPNLESVPATGIKRVDVSVSYNGRVVSTLSSLRTNGWPDEPTGSQADPEEVGVVEELLADIFK